MIPMVDLKVQYLQIKDEIDRGIMEALEKTQFILGPNVAAFETEAATPVFVDIDPRTFNIDPAAIEAAITSKSRAVLPVHLFGQPADMAAIESICRKHGLLLIEDCAQSFGAATGGGMTGSLGELG